MPARAQDAAKPDPLITEVQDWNRYLGDGVDKRPYGVPSKFEVDVIRRDVSWLTASPESSVNFTPLHELEGIITPSGLCFERHHGGVAEINPADHRLMINGLRQAAGVHDGRHQAHAAREQDLLPGMRGEFRHGMAWCAGSIGCQFTHGMVHNVMYTGVSLKTLLNEAGLKPNAKRG